MKSMKKVFSTLLIVALIVPCVFALSACGGNKNKNDKFDTSTAYAAIVNYIKAKRENPVKKITTIFTGEDDGTTSKIIYGFDESGDPAANNYFAIVYEDGELTLKEYTGIDNSDSQKYIYTWKDGVQQPAQKFEDAEYSTYVKNYKGGLDEFMSPMQDLEEMLGDLTLTFEQFKDDMESIAALDNSTIEFVGTKYEDGSIGFSYTIITSTTEEYFASGAEIIVKNNKLLSITDWQQYTENGEKEVNKLEVHEGYYLDDLIGV